MKSTVRAHIRHLGNKKIQIPRHKRKIFKSRVVDGFNRAASWEDGNKVRFAALYKDNGDIKATAGYYDMEGKPVVSKNKIIRKAAFEVDHDNTDIEFPEEDKPKKKKVKKGMFEGRDLIGETFESGSLVKHDLRKRKSKQIQSDGRFE